jgi:hypothetical protein
LRIDPACLTLHVTQSGDPIVPTPTTQRVQKRRNALRAAGLRPIQIWVPDTRQPGFEAECRRQSRLAAQADAADVELGALMDAALVDILSDEK